MGGEGTVFQLADKAGKRWELPLIWHNLLAVCVRVRVCELDSHNEVT